MALLARNLKVTFVVCDHDRVETKNTQSQFHTKMGLRRNKAQALQQAMQGMYGLRIETVPHRLTTDNADQILGGAKLVIDCTDNIAAREVIQTYVTANDIACVHGALDANGTFGRVVWTEHFKGDGEGEEGEATCEDGETLPFGAKVAAQIAWAAQEYLADGKKRSYQITRESIQRIT